MAIHPALICVHSGNKTDAAWFQAGWTSEPRARLNRWLQIEAVSYGFLKTLMKPTPSNRKRAGHDSSHASKSQQHAKKYWSADVTENSDAMDLEDAVFKKRSAADIAKSLKRSAEKSKRRKGTPFQSAMSMLTFYINRAGKNLSEARLRTLDNAKQELRKAFGRKP